MSGWRTWEVRSKLEMLPQTKSIGRNHGLHTIPGARSNYHLANFTASSVPWVHTRSQCWDTPWMWSEMPFSTSARAKCLLWPSIIHCLLLQSIYSGSGWKHMGKTTWWLMFGGLHIEMAALKTLGDWLQGSGWTHALSQAEIATAGTADSFLQASHVTSTRRAHQVTAAALYILQRHAYDKHSVSAKDDQPPEDFKDWCHEKQKRSPQFLYWLTVLYLELSILIYVRSVREANFNMCLDALTDIVLWFFVLDHIHYAQWILVHLHDMAELPQQHPEIYNEFKAGHFTVQKSKRAFSAIPLDQEHEQNNARVEGDRGAVGLTDNPSALRRWMVTGPDVARVIMEFEEANMYPNVNEETCHHEETPSAQKGFAKDVQSFVAVTEKLGNPFKKDSPDLLVLDTRDIADPAVTETFRTVKQIGQEQFEAYSNHCLIDRTKTNLWRGTSSPSSDRTEDQKCPKERKHLWRMIWPYLQGSSLHQLPEPWRELDEFFRHENQACPPALSDAGKLHLGSKSQLLECLEGVAVKLSLMLFCCPWWHRHHADVEAWHYQAIWRVCPPSLHPIRQRETALCFTSRLRLG